MPKAENGRPVESVWDYPRPPAVVACERRVRVLFAGRMLADSISALRVLETASPPTLYVPARDVRTELLREHPGMRTLCEWKGDAVYFDAVAAGRSAAAAAWSYPRPREGYRVLREHFAFYPGRVSACYLDEEPVRPQPGEYYGGWVTAEIEGPLKGAPGSEGW